MVALVGRRADSLGDRRAPLWLLYAALLLTMVGGSHNEALPHTGGTKIFPGGHLRRPSRSRAQRSAFLTRTPSTPRAPGLRSVVLSWPFALLAFGLMHGVIRGHDRYGTQYLSQPFRILIYAAVGLTLTYARARAALPEPDADLLRHDRRDVLPSAPFPRNGHVADLVGVALDRRDTRPRPLDGDLSRRRARARVDQPGPRPTRPQTTPAHHHGRIRGLRRRRVARPHDVRRDRRPGAAPRRRAPPAPAHGSRVRAPPARRSPSSSVRSSSWRHPARRRPSGPLHRAPRQRHGGHPATAQVRRGDAGFSHTTRSSASASADP